MSVSDIAKLKKQRSRRKRSIRKRISGTPECPRLTVTKSLRYISAQIIDDTTGRTIASASTKEKELKKNDKTNNNVECAEVIGKAIGERAKAKNIEKVVFDRNGYIYHGRVKAFAEAARKSGLQF